MNGKRDLKGYFRAHQALTALSFHGPCPTFPCYIFPLFYVYTCFSLERMIGLLKARTRDTKNIAKVFRVQS